MPTPEEIKRQREYNELIKEENRLRAEREGRTASDIYTRESVNNAANLISYAQQLTEDAKEQAGYVSSKAESDKKLVSLARQLSNSAASITSELGREQAVAKQIQNDRKLQRDIEISLANARAQLTEQDAIAQGKLVAAGQKRAFVTSELNKLVAEYNRLLAAGADPSGEVLSNLSDQVKEQEKLVAKADEDYDLAQQSISDAAKKVANLEEQFDLSTKLVADREAELKIQKEITKATGVTGAVVEGLGGIMQRLGLRSGIFNQAMEDAANEMRRIAGDAKKAGENISKTKVAVAGLGKLLGGLKGGLLDPAVIGGAVLKSFFEVDKAATNLRRLTGQNSMEVSNLNSRLATSVDFLETAAQLTNQTGLNALSVFSPDVLAGAAELKNTMGLAADEAGGLAIIAQTTSGDIDEVTNSIVDTTSAFNKTNRAAVSQGVILRDVAKASDGIKASFSGMPGQLAKAAAAARRMGMDLARVDQIASSLMDFESSIEAELEAQLLTGRSINLGKARELALNNKLAELGEELFKNTVNITEFGKMNRIQQEAQAKALGMTRDELAKVAYQRAKELKMTDEAAAAAAGVTAEDMKRLEAQEALQLAFAKLTQAFAPVLNIVADLANIIAPLVAKVAKMVGYVVAMPGGIGKIAIAAVVAARAFGGFGGLIQTAGKGIGGLIRGTQNLGKSLVSAFTKPKSALGKLQEGFKKLQESFKSGFKGDAVGKITKDAQGRFRDAKGRFAKAPTSAAKKLGDSAKAPTSAAKKLGDSAKTMPKGTEKSTGGMKSLTDTISKIDPKKLLAGAAAMVIAAGAVFVFAKATQEFMKVTWTAVGKAIVSLVALVGAVAALGAIMSSGVGTVAILAGAAAMVIMAGGLYVLGKAMQEIGVGLGTIGENITSVGDAVTAELLGRLFDLGPALISAAIGIAAFTGAAAVGSIGALFGGGVMNQLEKLAELAPPLSTVGVSLTAVAAGVSALALALQTLETEKLDELKGLVMTTAFAAPAVAATGAITSLIEGITGGGEQETNRELLAEIKLLREAVSQGGDVYIDGNKVGESLMLASTKLS